MKHICFIIHQYTNPVRPSVMNYLQDVAWQIRDCGYKVTVVSPLMTNLNKDYKNVPYHLVEKTYKGNNVDVFFPKTIGFGVEKKVCGYSFSALTAWFFQRKAEECMNKEGIKPDIVYGHFLSPSGVAVSKIGKKLGIPAFFAVGESYKSAHLYGLNRTRKVLESTTGMICVSSALRNYFTKNTNLIDPNKTIVLPNGFDASRFTKIDKKEARKKLGLPEDVIIAAFIGSFNHRKGIMRVCEALERQNTVKLICAGQDGLKPYGKNLLLATHVKPKDVPPFLYAADMFVLPTLSEGCCNAIVEALACGLPIISSKGDFNDDILNDECSIRLDPSNVDELEAAINKLGANETLRRRMSEASLKKAESLTLEARLEKIIKFIDRE